MLRDALRAEFGDYPFVLEHSATPFLRGLAAAGVDGAKQLIDAIEQHESIELWIEC